MRRRTGTRNRVAAYSLFNRGIHWQQQAQCIPKFVFQSIKEALHMASDSVEYMCRFCGKKQMSYQSRGRPEPGHCPRNPRKSGGPHSWSVNRRWKAATSSVKPALSKMIEYMCRYCGQKTMLSQSRGRPEPGHCPRKNRNGAHSWIINRRF